MILTCYHLDEKAFKESNLSMYKNEMCDKKLHEIRKAVTVLV